MICDLENTKEIQDIIKKEGLDLMVVSYGGSCTNQLVDLLENNSYKCRTNTWDIIFCHAPKYIECDIPIIYIYDNPIKSFLSMKNRRYGMWDVNQRKMSNNNEIELSDENLLKCMINQFNNWTNVKKDNLLIIKTSELFDENIVDKLNKFLKKNINHFPVKYVKPKTDINNILDEDLINLFNKYQDDINKINNFTTNS